MRVSEADERYVAFVQARSADLLRVAVHMCGNRDAAWDLTQTALEKAYRAWTRIEQTEDPYGYVRRILVNTHRDGWRRTTALNRLFGRREPDEIGFENGEVVARTSGAVDPGEVATRRRQTAALLDRLAPRERAVIVLRFLEDLSEAETAEELGVSVGTVKSTQSRALAKLRVTGADDDHAQWRRPGGTSTIAREA